MQIHPRISVRRAGRRYPRRQLQNYAFNSACRSMQLVHGFMVTATNAPRANLHVSTDQRPGRLQTSLQDITLQRNIFNKMVAWGPTDRACT